MKKNNPLFAMLIMICIVSFTSCTTEEDTPPPPPPPPLCETNDTGEVFFSNTSNSNSTHDIIWDGVKIATVAPNQSSQVFTYSAGVPHTLVFRFTNTSDDACTASTPILTQCQQQGFSCSG